MAKAVVPRSSDEHRDWHVMASGAVSGFVGGWTCFPFEAIKKKLQSGQLPTHSNIKKMMAAAEKAKLPALLKLNLDPTVAKRIIVAEENAKLRALFKFHLHPREIYRGSTAFGTAVMGNTFVLVTFQRLIQKTPGYDPKSETWKAVSAVGAGVLGGMLASTPVENIILTQQLHQLGPIATIRKLFAQSLTRPFVGMPELMMREAGFAAVMLYGTRAAADYVREKTKKASLVLRESAAWTAGLAVCFLGATGTHPFDTVATIKQKANGALTSRVAWTSLYQQEGFLGFFRGLSGRIPLFTGCAIIIPLVDRCILPILKKL
jgi:hypothetical protein